MEFGSSDYYSGYTFPRDCQSFRAFYNLDGGGSSTLYFNGQVINKPTTGGNKISERAVSDIVYIGY